MAQEIVTGEGQQTLLLAHGAGAPMDSPFMTMLAEALGRRGVRVVRFEFSYMNQRRQDGKKRPPPKAEKLVGEFDARIEACAADSKPLFVGGKSMGGRIASLLTRHADARLSGCICFGYPFHPPGKPDRWRTEHLAEPAMPVLIEQGTRDPFGRQDEVLAHFEAGLPFDLNWLEDGEHDFKPRKASGFTQADLIDKAAQQAAKWMMSIS